LAVCPRRVPSRAAEREVGVKIVVMDESRRRAVQIAEQLQRSKHDVTCFTMSNDFMAAIGRSPLPHRVALDMETWRNGRSIYSYFGVARKLEDVPMVFYNAPEDFVLLQDRPRHNKDEILPGPPVVEAVVEALGKSS
jgi:hypothetical protein